MRPSRSLRGLKSNRGRSKSPATRRAAAPPTPSARRPRRKRSVSGRTGSSYRRATSAHPGRRISRGDVGDVWLTRGALRTAWLSGGTDAWGRRARRTSGRGVAALRSGSTAVETLGGGQRSACCGALRGVASTRRLPRHRAPRTTDSAHRPSMRGERRSPARTRRCADRDGRSPTACRRGSPVRRGVDEPRLRAATRRSRKPISPAIVVAAVRPRARSAGNELAVGGVEDGGDPCRGPHGAKERAVEEPAPAVRADVGRPQIVCTPGKRVP
jgi:hypothetical protein